MPSRGFVLRIENYLPEISQIALQHWRRLPKQTRLWVDPEDFLQDGLIFVRTVLMPRFVFTKGTKFSTYIFIPLHRFFRAYRESLTCDKRFKNTQTLKQLAEGEQFKQELYVAGMDSYYTMLKLYEAASSNLQRYLEEWFFDRRGTTKCVRTSKGFQRAKREFLTLAPKYKVTARVCEELLQANRSGLLFDLEAR
jgi:hypothetical protein